MGAKGKSIHCTLRTVQLVPNGFVDHALALDNRFAFELRGDANDLDLL